MLLFLDSCNINEINELASYGLVDGVTTNPTLLLNSNRNLYELLKEICSIVTTSVSAEVVATEYSHMLAEAEKLLEISDAITIKLPITWDGLRACKKLRGMNVKTNMTLCFNSTQAILAAKCSATYISPFIGRLDDAGNNGIHLVKEIKEIFNNYESFETKILVASVRNLYHLIEAAKIGADAITISPSIMKQMIAHDLTNKGLTQFLKDWKKTGQEI